MAIVAIMLILFSQQVKFFLVALGCSVLFLQLPLWITISIVLLWRYHRLWSVAGIIVVILLEVVAYDAFFIEPTALEVTRYKITDARIQTPMRIVVIADLQTDHIGEYERKTLQMALDQKPDLILFAGDYLCYGTIENGQQILAKFEKLLKDLHFDAPLGVYAVRGNLENWLPWSTAFRDISGERINHRTQSFEIGDIRLTCLSELDSFRKNLRLRNHDDGRFHLVLGHCPNYALGEVDADLLLAGHTHGGQIRLPLIGPLSTGCAVPRSWAAGLTELPELNTPKQKNSSSDAPRARHLIVSRGTGMERGVSPRIRFLCRPELVVIDLKPAKSTQSSPSVIKMAD